MSGETRDEVSPWTIDSLHQHITTIHQTMRNEYLAGMEDIRRDYLAALAAMEKALEAAFTASQTAIDKQERAVHERFASVNEFRQQLGDQAALFMPRAEAEALSKRNAERIDDLKERMDRSEGHNSGLAAGWGYLLGGIAAFSTIVALILAFTA